MVATSANNVECPMKLAYHFKLMTFLFIVYLCGQNLKLNVLYSVGVDEIG